MAPSIGLNLRVTGHCNQGGRKYMEDVFSVAYQQTEDELDLEYAFFGIFDGHGGKEAALFAKEHLMDNITKQPNFWSENDDLVLKSIREGFLKTQQDMWGDLENWTKTRSGLPSTAGTTASIAFIRRGKIFVGHVGDSGIVLGEQHEDYPEVWLPRSLTRDHKPECERELARIEEAGGKVVSKSGVPRVVWNRPKIGHTGPVRRSTHMDEVPFLAVARALGDLWSYNSKKDVFVVSPEPDLHVYSIDISKHRCLILGTDGAWNVLSPEAAVNAVKVAEKNNEKHMLDPEGGHSWQNPSKRLVDLGIERWNAYKLRADNTSVVVVMLDPPGPPRAQVLRRQRELTQNIAGVSTKKQPCNNDNAPPLPPKPPKPAKGLAIISRFPNSKKPEEVQGKNLVNPATEESEPESLTAKTSSRIIHDSTKNEPHKIKIPHTWPAGAAPTSSPSTMATSRITSATTSSSTSSSSSSSSSSVSSSLQDNVVTSSMSDTDADRTEKFVSRVPGRNGNKPTTSNSRKSISRELANLALDSPGGARGRSRRSTGTSSGSSSSGISSLAGGGRPTLKPKRRGRSIDGLTDGAESDGSDVENMNLRGGGGGGESGGGGSGRGEKMVPVSKLKEVERKCEDLNNKLQEIEKKVSSQAKLLQHGGLRSLRSTLDKEEEMGAGGGESSDNWGGGPATPRILRSQNSNVAEAAGPRTPASGTKRRRHEAGAGGGLHHPVPVKRERTVTWAAGGKVGGSSSSSGKLGLVPPNSGPSSRKLLHHTRRSTGGLIDNTSPGRKLRGKPTPLRRK